MSGWAKDDQIEGDVSSAVAAAAAEFTALSEYEYLPELDLHYDRSSGYFFKQGHHDFHHASSHYTYHFDESTSNWQCKYEPDWDETVGCQLSIDAYVLLLDMLEKLQADENAPEIEDDDEGRSSASPTEECLPCIRAIALESDHLPYGHLSIVTIDGASISNVQETDDFDCGLVLENEISNKTVCSIQFNTDSRSFYVEKVLTEGGEEEGEMVVNTAISIVLNGKNVETDTAPLSHQDRLSIDAGDAGFISLSLHIHKGMNTCAGCEPGLLLSDWRGTTVQSSVSSERSSPMTRAQLERSRRRELKQMKKKYSLSRVDYVQGESAKFVNDKYTDRARIRRQTVGSDLPTSASEAMESRMAASTSKAMDEGNRGYKMLQKMGWKQGAGIGKKEDGMQEPICPVGHMDSSGLGASSSLRISVGTANEAQKRFKWSKAAQRYAKLEKTCAVEFSIEELT